jgi:hypothetical protein
MPSTQLQLPSAHPCADGHRRHLVVGSGKMERIKNVHRVNIPNDIFFGKTQHDGICNDIFLGIMPAAPSSSPVQRRPLQQHRCLRR